MTLGQYDEKAFLASAVAPSAARPVGAPGVYAILLAAPDALPGVAVGREGLLYLGMTRATLEARNHFRHAHSGFSTFRRSLGAILASDLGLSAIPRGPGASKSNVQNYRFSDEGERALTAWMERHLLIAQMALPGDLARIEKDLIASLEPPLNLTGWPNPQRAALKALRAACAAQARSSRIGN